MLFIAQYLLGLLSFNAYVFFFFLADSVKSMMKGSVFVNLLQDGEAHGMPGFMTTLKDIVVGSEKSEVT